MYSIFRVVEVTIDVKARTVTCKGKTFAFDLSRVEERLLASGEADGSGEFVCVCLTDGVGLD